MFIKRKKRIGKVYAYRMLPSFKALVTFKKIIKLHPKRLCPLRSSQT